MQATDEPGLVRRLGQGDGSQGLFEGGVEGGRGRELVRLIFGFGQIIYPSLEQVEPAIGLVGGVGAQLNLQLFGPTLPRVERIARTEGMSFGQEDDAAGQADKKDDAEG